VPFHSRPRVAEFRISHYKKRGLSGEQYETARIPQSYRWFGGRLAARGAGAAASDTSDRSSERQRSTTARSSWPHLARALTKQVFSSIEM
jgi:hypothetical protein